MAVNPNVCAACGASGATHEHALTRGGPHYPSVWLCAGCRAVVTSRRPDRARVPAKPPRRPVSPPAEALSPMVEAVRALPRLDGS